MFRTCYCLRIHCVLVTLAQACHLTQAQWTNFKLPTNFEIAIQSLSASLTACFRAAEGEAAAKRACFCCIACCQVNTRRVYLRVRVLSLRRLRTILKAMTLLQNVAYNCAFISLGLLCGVIGKALLSDLLVC
jgi:hypothetical protein